MIVFQTCTASSSKNPRESNSVLFLGHPDFSPSFLYTGLSSQEPWQNIKSGRTTNCDILLSKSIIRELTYLLGIGYQLLPNRVRFCCC